MATVLRALRTLNVRRAARFPKSMPIVRYLQKEKDHIVCVCCALLEKKEEPLFDFDKELNPEVALQLTYATTFPSCVAINQVSMTHTADTFCPVC